MMKLNVDENPGLAARYGIPGLVVLLATLFWFAPAALAFTPTPSGGFVRDMGSNDEVAQRNRVDDARSGLQLGLRAQEASDRGDYKDAEVLYERALLLFERALGPEDLRLVGPLANLADVYRALGKFDRAEVLYARVAFLMEEAFGPSDVLVGAALADTAEAVASQGHYGRAKNLYQRAFLIYQVSLGTEDPGTVRLFKDFDLQWTHHENSHRDVRRSHGPRNVPAAFAEGPQPQAVAIDRTADATVRVLVEGAKLLLGMNDIILEVRPSVESSEVSHAKLVAARPGLPTESVSVDLLPEGAGRFRGALTLPWTDSCRLEVAWDDAQGHHARDFVVPVIVGHH